MNRIYWSDLGLIAMHLGIALAGAFSIVLSPILTGTPWLVYLFWIAAGMALVAYDVNSIVAHSDRIESIKLMFAEFSNDSY